MHSITAVILVGGLRRTRLHQQTGIHPLHLPLRPDRAMLDCWLESIRLAFGGIETIVVGEDRGEFMRGAPRDQPKDVEFQIDPRPHRGTAGVLADLAAGQNQAVAGSDFLLVVDGSSCPPKKLKPMRAAADGEAQLAFGVSDIDRLAGCMLLRTAALDRVPRIGYFDTKEQLAPRIRSEPGGITGVPLVKRALMINSLENWLLAVRYHGETEASLGGNSTPSDRDSCVSRSAIVGQAAVIKSVVMPGAVIGDGAVVARSAIGPGVRIPENGSVVDGIIWH